jgi:cytochrome c-type protein NapB
MSENVPPTEEQPRADATAMMPGQVRRYAVLAVVLALGVVLVGFLRGVREPPAVSRQAPAPGTVSTNVPPAIRYDELPAHPRRASDGKSFLSALKYDRPDVFAPVTRTEEMRSQALADRAKNRAFDGAPPTIPHSIDQMTTASCLLCHGEGVKVVDRVATKVSHPHYANCTQCHVESSRPELDRHATPVAASTFSGAYRAGPGTRAGPGAPPTIPHTTWFRNDCMSCHGLLTRPGTRTTHPWLTNCTQCHVPSAALDQVAFPEVRP